MSRKPKKRKPAPVKKVRAKKKKGIKYIAQSLTKYFGKKYSSYKVALPRARELKKLLVGQKKKVGLKAIFEQERKKRGPKLTAPELPQELAQESYYFDLVDYPVWITRCDNRIWFKSKLWPKALPDIQGGSTPEYNDYFGPFVNYINSLSQGFSKEDRQYEHDWLVTCTTPVYNKNKSRWESTIISIDATGASVTYGFDPEKPLKTTKTPQKAPEPAKTEKPPKIEEKTPPTPSSTAPDTELVKAQASKIKAEAEILRQQNISNALKLFGEGIITKAEFKELMNKI